MQAAGIANVLTKSIGTTNPHNVVKATIAALDELRDKAQVAELRGLARGKPVRSGERPIMTQQATIKVSSWPARSARKSGCGALSAALG